MALLPNQLRIVTAAALFDGHDAAINIMRRILQRKGVEVIHLGHNRSVSEIVECALEEDAQAVAITSYQGGHMEFFQYMRDLLDENGGRHVLLFGGGGGTILPGEIEDLHRYGITRIYSPDDGRRMGLEGMIEDLLDSCKKAMAGQAAGPKPQFSASGPQPASNRFALGEWTDILTIARAISLAENGEDYAPLVEKLARVSKRPGPQRKGFRWT